jgi:hypothetical protein
MRGRWLFAAALTVVTGYAITLGDWKSELAKKAVGRVAREGLEDALGDALRDAAFDAAAGAIDLDRIGRDVRDAARRAELGSTAREAVEVAMTASDVASTIDAALDAAEAAKKINKVRKAIKILK